MLRDDYDEIPDMDLTLELSDDEFVDNARPRTSSVDSRFTNSRADARLTNNRAGANRKLGDNANRYHHQQQQQRAGDSKRASSQSVNNLSGKGNTDIDPGSAIEKKRIQMAKAAARVRGKQFCKVCHYCKHPTHSCSKQPCPGVDCGVLCNALTGEFASEDRHRSLHKEYYQEQKQSLKKAERERKQQNKVCFYSVSWHSHCLTCLIGQDGQDEN